MKLEADEEIHLDVVSQAIARDYFQLGRNTVQVWLQRGKIKPVMVYGRRYVRLSDIRKFCFDPHKRITP